MRQATSLGGLLISLLFLVLTIGLGLTRGEANQLLSFIDQPAVGYVRVLEVVDGDTIIVKFGDSTEKVRFIGVDTPETNHPDKAVQCFGKAATQYLQDAIEGDDVRLEADPTNTNRDRYDRLLRYVYDQENTLLNQQIIADGYGFAYIAFPFEKKDDFVDTQTLARESELGLWSECEVEQDGIFFNTDPA